MVRKSKGRQGGGGVEHGVTRAAIDFAKNVAAYVEKDFITEQVGKCCRATQSDIWIGPVSFIWPEVQGHCYVQQSNQRKSCRV